MKKLIGYCGVDSGQILICDPCYIDSEWEKEEFNVLRRVKHTDGTVLQYGKDFKSYAQIVEKYGKTVNQMMAENEVIEMPDDQPSEHPFSYNACCKKTLGNSEDGQLNFKLGHEGAGVVSRSGFGDGFYPVYANIDEKEGRVKSLTIKFF